MNPETALANAELARLSTLRAELLEHHPFWGHLLLQVALVPTFELPAFAATDCIRHIWFNPERTKHLSHAQLGFVVAHELGHQVFESRQRAGDRNPHRWNCATDYAINRIVASIPDPARPQRTLYDPIEGQIGSLGEVRILLDDRFDGRAAETIYELLQDEVLPVPERAELELPIPMDGRRVRPRGCSDHGGGIDIHLPGELTSEQRRELEQRIATAAAAAGGQQAGTVPANLLRQAPPSRSRIEWRSILRDQMERAVGEADTYSRARPNRRWLAQDVLVPTVTGSAVPWVVVAVDTSGSMSQDDLSRVLGALRALAPLATELTVLVGDCRLHDVLDLDEALQRLEHGGWRGGGGTDHRPMFEWVQASGRRPDVFVGLTDLHSRFPREAPDYPVLWVTPRAHGVAPWGTVIPSAPRHQGP